MDYNAFVRWQQSSEKEFEKDLNRKIIQKSITIGYILFMILLFYLFYLSNVFNVKNLPIWVPITLLIFIIGVPFTLSIFNRKLKDNEFVSILLMKISNEIDISSKRKGNLISYLKILNDIFDRSRFNKDEDLTLYEKSYTKIQNFDNKIISLAKRLYHATINNQLKSRNSMKIKMLANSIFYQDDGMFSQIDGILSEYSNESNLPKKLDFLKKLRMPKNKWLILILCEVIIVLFLYLIWLIFELQKDTVFILFGTITAAVIYVIFK